MNFQCEMLKFKDCRLVFQNFHLKDIEILDISLIFALTE